MTIENGAGIVSEHDAKEGFEEASTQERPKQEKAATPRKPNSYQSGFHSAYSAE